MTDPKPQEPYTIELSPNEQLVLFEFLSRCVHDSLWIVEDTAEWQVLSSLLVGLEKRLSEPFREDYTALLEAARAALRPEDLTLKDITSPHEVEVIFDRPRTLANLADEQRAFLASLSLLLVDIDLLSEE